MYFSRYINEWISYSIIQSFTIILSRLSLYRDLTFLPEKEIYGFSICINKSTNEELKYLGLVWVISLFVLFYSIVKVFSFLLGSTCPLFSMGYKGLTFSPMWLDYMNCSEPWFYSCVVKLHEWKWCFSTTTPVWLALLWFLFSFTHLD